MPELLQATLVEGQIIEATMNWQPSEHCILTLRKFEKQIVVPFFPPSPSFPKLGAHISAICSDDTPNTLLAIDLIISDYDEGPISEQQRSDLFRRVGLRPIYRPQPDFSSSLVLASLKDLEREMIAYLRRYPVKMRGMHPDAFEKLIAELMANFGFDVEWTARDKRTAADVSAFKTDIPSLLVQNYIIECKRNSEKNRVGVEIARALYGAKVDENFSNALLVTTSFFEEGVEKFAAKRWDF